MARTMHPEASMRSADGEPIPFDEELVRGEIQRAIIPSRNMPGLPAFIGLTGEFGNITGSIYLSMETPLWYTRQIGLVERWLYVAPDYRRSHIAAVLIDFAKQAADAAQTKLFVGHTTPGREAAKERFYRRHFTPVGAFYVYDGTAGV